MREFNELNVKFDTSSKEFKEEILKSVLDQFIIFHEHDLGMISYTWEYKFILIPKKEADYTYSRIKVMFADMDKYGASHSTSLSKIIIVREDRVGENKKYRVYTVCKDDKVLASFQTKYSNISEDFGRIFKPQLDKLKTFKMKKFDAEDLATDKKQFGQLFDELFGGFFADFTFVKNDSELYKLMGSGEIRRR